VGSVVAHDRIDFGLKMGRSWYSSAIAIAINGRALREVVAEVEAAEATCSGGLRSRGGYVDLSFEVLRLSVREHFLGEPQRPSRGVTEGTSLLLMCGCGLCGRGVVARIQVDERDVTWRDIGNTNQPWTHAAFDDTRFDRRQYLHAISRLEVEIDEAVSRAAFGAWRWAG
jgi:hypothetical protein